MIYDRIGGGRTIRNITINVADESDFEFAQLLQDLGVKRNVAHLITYLKCVEEASSRDIEKFTGLRQPEVSIAMRTLRERDWIAEHEIKQEGKGRPMKIYKLNATIDEIIGYYETERIHESNQTKMAIQRLKELSSA
jgi:predicted transcriptional regulator